MRCVHHNKVRNTSSKYENKVSHYVISLHNGVKIALIGGENGHFPLQEGAQPAMKSKGTRNRHYW